MEDCGLSEKVRVERHDELWVFGSLVSIFFKKIEFSGITISS